MEPLICIIKYEICSIDPELRMRWDVLILSMGFVSTNKTEASKPSLGHWAPGQRKGILCCRRTARYQEMLDE